MILCFWEFLVCQFFDFYTPFYLLFHNPQLELVDSFEQARQRPEDNEEQKKYYSGKKKQHTFKNQVIGFPKGEEIVDILVGERGPKADINLLKKQQKN